MKIAVGLIMLAGDVLGTGAAMEFGYFGPSATQFRVGGFTAPASMFFAWAGVSLWRRGIRARSMVFGAALVMAGASIAATVLDVMGPSAKLMGLIGAFVALGWARSRRALNV